MLIGPDPTLENFDWGGLNIPGVYATNCTGGFNKDTELIGGIGLGLGQN